MGKKLVFKNISFGTYSVQALTIHGDVLEGDIIRVDCDEAGAFLLINEEIYAEMDEALKAIHRLGTSGKLPEELKRFYKK